MSNPQPTKRYGFTQIQQLEGLIPTVTAVPTWTPRKFSEQFAIYNDADDEFRFYWYDNGVDAWKYTTQTSTQFSAITADTNGTTAVSVFGAGGYIRDITITGVYLISKDTTAGNITVENPTATVVSTIAKGTVAGVMVGASSLANTSVTAGTNLVVDSSTAGNATVFITFTI